MLTPFPRPKIKEIPKLGKRYYIFVSFLTEREGGSELLSTYRYYNVRYKSCPFSLKYGISKTDEYNILNTVKDINNLLYLKRDILIHCAAGIDRTGFMTSLICLSGGYSLKETIEIIKDKRPKILERLDKHIPLIKEFNEKLRNLQNIRGEI
jgi:hypothetical protein